MSDDGALSGAMMLSEQLAMYRTMDALDRARYNNELAVEIQLLRDIVRQDHPDHYPPE